MRKKERNLPAAGRRTKNLSNLCATLALDQDALFDSNPTIADVAEKYFIFFEVSYKKAYHTKRNKLCPYLQGILFTFTKAENGKRRAFVEIECKYVI